MTIFTDRATDFFTGYQGQITSSAQDTRACRDYGLLRWKISGQSAVFSLDASHDLTAWMPVVTLTGTATETGTAQIQGYFPYVRGQIIKAYTGTGGALSATATVWLHYAPGVG